MNVIWKAACAAALIAATLIELGCGDVYRPISTPLPVTSGNPSGPETEVVLNLCPSGSVCLDNTGAPSGSVLTDIDVSGDTNAGNKPLYNTVASPVGPAPGSLASPMAFNAARTAVLTANTITNSVTQATLGTSTAGFAANTTTVSLPTGSAPIGISFEYFGTYTQDYVVNSGLNTLNCPGTGSVSAILEATDQLAATVCVGTDPVFAWIYYDQSKVFVLDYTGGEVYVVNATTYQVTHIIPVGSGPFKVAQSNTGQYIYVLNSNGTISVIDGLNETVLQTVTLGTACPVCSAAPVDLAMDPNFNDTSTNTQINHVWVLHADGTVSVWDGTTPGKLTWITAVATITPAQAAAPTLAYPTNLALMRDGTYAYVGVGNTDQIVGINTSQLAEAGTITLGVNPCPGGLTCSGIPATTSITVGVHRNGGTVDAPLTWSLMDTVINQTTSATTTYGPFTVPVELTTPTVTSVAVSREGSNTGSTGYSADLSKVYATTSTNTIYYCYNYQAVAVDCSDPNGEVWTNGQALTNAEGVIDGIQATTFVTSAAPVPQGPAFLAAGCTQLATNPTAMSCPNLYAGTSVVAAAASGTTPINSYVTTIPAPSVVTYCSPGNPATGEFDGQKNCPAMTPVLVLGRS
jgi:YVTN family beta-propeller protein